MFFSNCPGCNSKFDSVPEAPIGFSLVMKADMLCDMFSQNEDLHTFLELFQNATYLEFKYAVDKCNFKNS